MTSSFRVSLTFDAEHPDRPHDSGADARVLDVLDATATPATFFLQGRWVEASPDLARHVAAAGHLVGSHSHYHVRMPLLTPAGLRTDVRAAERVIRGVTGVDPRPWFRLPFGAGSGSALLTDVIAAMGYRHVGWDVEAGEWHARANRTSVERRIVDGTLAHGDGAIVLLHTWPTPVSHALPAAIERLREAGARFVRLDELDLPPGLMTIDRPASPASA